MSLVDRHRKTLIWSGACTLGAIVVTLALAMLLNTSARWAWLAVITALTAGVFFYDKVVSRQENVQKRVPELALLFLCLIGGSVGGLVVMLGRRHKTADAQFKLMLGIIVGLQIGFILYWVISTLTAPSGS